MSRSLQQTIIGGAVAATLGLSATLAQAASINDGNNGLDGWNMDNVEVIVNDGGGTYDETTGDYSSDYVFFRSEVSDTVGPDGTGTVMGAVKGKDYPVGAPPGIKVINSGDNAPLANGTPSNCIMNTSFLEGGYLDSTMPMPTLCGSGFQTHKRFKVNMEPATVDGSGVEAVDLVFNVDNASDTEVRDYRIFQKINNYTGKRLSGFEVQLGTGVGANFSPVGATGTTGQVTTDNLGVKIPADIWDDDQLATFSSGLFGPPDPPKFPDPGFFDSTKAGFNVQLKDANDSDVARNAGTSGAKIVSTSVLGSNYAQSPPFGPSDQFGEWIHSGQTPLGIFFDDDNDPETDDQLVAFWGATNAAGTEFAWMRGDPDGWTTVAPAQVDEWLSSSAYSVGVIEDLLNLGLNYIVSVGDLTNALTYDAGADTASFTVRIKPVVASSQTDPAYVSNPPEFRNSDGEIVIGPQPVEATEPLRIRVTDGDIVAGSDPVSVVVENKATGETEQVRMSLAYDGVLTANLPTSISPLDDADNSGVIYAKPGSELEATYIDADDGSGGVDVANTATTLVVLSNSGGGASGWGFLAALVSLLAASGLRRRRLGMT